MLIYSPLCAMMSFLSACTASLVVIKLRRDLNVYKSCVMWLFYVFFVYVVVWNLARSAFFIWKSCDVRVRRVDPRYKTGEINEGSDLDLLGIPAVAASLAAHDGVLTTILVIGDTLFFSHPLWTVALTVELARLAKTSMDRGVIKEKLWIRRYACGIHAITLVFFVVQGALAVHERGYTLMVVQGGQVGHFVNLAGLVYVGATLVYLRVRRYTHEAVHGTLVPSPIYRRLKTITLIYVLFAAQFQIASVVYIMRGSQGQYMLPTISAGMVMFNSMGLALSCAAGCSQECMINTCPMLPLTSANAYAGASFEPTEPPQRDPVFVYTDIESSSALWAIAEDDVMQQSIDIHDAIVRSSLLNHRGYEITTCGDSFQLAFASIGDAVSFCVEVQLRLITAPWPKRLHGLLPATRRQWNGYRWIYRGLRVRMGVHAQCSGDGILFCHRHAITGRMTYTGASEALASELGDLGLGGQILTSDRVATWTREHRDICPKVSVEHIGNVRLDQLGVNCDVYELLSTGLTGRRKHVTMRRSPFISVGAPRPPQEINPAIGSPVSATNYTCLEV